MATIQNKNEYVYKSNYIYVILLMKRPGATTFMVKLEHEHFPPHDQSLNDLYTVHYIRHDGEPYVIVGVPMEYLQQCNELAEKNCLRLVNGTPLTAYIKEDQQQQSDPAIDHKPFPIHHSHDLTYTLENIKSYESLEKIQKGLQMEGKILQKYLKRYYELHPST